MGVSGVRRTWEAVAAAIRSSDASAKAGASPFSAMTLDLPPELLAAFEDHTALLGAIAAANGQNPLRDAQKAVQPFLLPPEEVETVTGHVSQAAMRRFMGKAVDGPIIDAPLPIQEHLEETVGLAWVAWTRGDVEGARKLLDRTRPFIEGRRHESGMTLLGLLLWNRAISTLLDGNREEARRLWGRAMEVGTTFGLEATDMIRWTYAGTFAG